MSSKPTAFSRPSGQQKEPKSRGNPAAFCGTLVVEHSTLQPLWTAPATTIPAGVAVPTIPVPTGRAVVESAVAPCSTEPAAHMRQDRKPAFLAVIEGFVERVRRVRDLLQGRRRNCHVVGPFA